MRVAVVIPALDEEHSIGRVVRAMAAAVTSAGHVVQVYVADNGSRDRTADEARAAGAVVVVEPRRGYGAACLAALRAVPASPSTDAVLFADGDGADDPKDVPALLGPVATGQADLVIGSRAWGERLGLAEPGALGRAQRFGNRLATSLLRVLFAQRATDLGPFRVIRHGALMQLQMDDRGFGWTVQMQARAARLGLRVMEVPVRYHRRRTGRSKVSGDLKASAHAGVVILSTIAREAARSRR